MYCVSPSLLCRGNRVGSLNRGSRSVAARSSVGGLRMTSCDRSPRKRSGSLTLSPSCPARSLPRSRRLGSLSVAPLALLALLVLLPLGSARAVSLSASWRAPAAEGESERAISALRRANQGEKERNSARGRE